MKLKDTVQFAEQYLALYFGYFVSIVLLKPDRLLKPSSEPQTPVRGELVVPNAETLRYEFNPNLIGFLVISIALATAIFGVVFFDVLAPADFLGASLVTIFFWFLAGSSIWCLVRVTGTRRQYLEVVSQAMAIFAVVQVISNEAQPQTDKHVTTR